MQADMPMFGKVLILSSFTYMYRCFYRLSLPLLAWSVVCGLGVCLRLWVIARAWSVGCLRDRTKDVANFFLDVNFPSSYCHVTPIRYRPVTGGLFAFVFLFELSPPLRAIDLGFRQVF